MYLNIDGKDTEKVPIHSFEVVNKKNIKLIFVTEKNIDSSIVLMPMEISHIMRIGFHLPVIDNPDK